MTKFIEFHTEHEAHGVQDDGQLAPTPVTIPPHTAYEIIDEIVTEQGVAIYFTEDDGTELAVFSATGEFADITISHTPSNNIE